MASIFQGTDQLVHDVFTEYGLRPRNGRHHNPSYYEDLGGLAKQSLSKGRRLVTDLLRRELDLIRDNARSALCSGDSSLGNGRGTLRTVVDLSKDRQSACLKESQDFEVTLERTIAYTRICDPKWAWYNQFNVASGFCGSESDRKTAVDLVRCLRRRPTQAEFIELKEWNSSDHPLYAAFEIYRYWCVYFVLAVERVDADNPRWPRMDRVELSVMAPHTWFESHGVDFDVRQFFALFQYGLANVAPAFSEKGVRVSFCPTGRKLSRLSRRDFRSSFSGPLNWKVHHLNDLLDIDAFRKFDAWILDALEEAPR